MKSIADAFADRLANLVNGIKADDFNPVRCCVCIVTGEGGKTEAVVRGYGVCASHVVAMDQGGSILEAMRVDLELSREVRKHARTG